MSQGEHKIIFGNSRKKKNLQKTKFNAFSGSKMFFRQKHLVRQNEDDVSNHGLLPVRTTPIYRTNKYIRDWNRLDKDYNKSKRHSKYKKFKNGVLRSKLNTEVLNIDAKRFTVDINFDSLNK